jgi:hypothetical protein
MLDQPIKEPEPKIARLINRVDPVPLIPIENLTQCLPITRDTPAEQGGGPLRLDSLGMG